MNAEHMRQISKLPRPGRRRISEWKYSIEDISKLTGLDIKTLYRKIKKKEFDPANLEEVISFILPYLAISALNGEC